MPEPKPLSLPFLAVLALVFAFPATGSATTAERCLVWYQRPATRVVEGWADGRRLFVRATDGAGRPLPAIPSAYARADELELWVVTETERGRWIIASGRITGAQRLPAEGFTPLDGPPLLPPAASALHGLCAQGTGSAPARERSVDDLADAFLDATPAAPPEEDGAPARPVPPPEPGGEPSVDDLADAFLDASPVRPSGEDDLDAEVERIVAEEGLELARSRPDDGSERMSPGGRSPVDAGGEDGPPASAGEAFPGEASSARSAHELRVGSDASRYESPNSTPPTADTTTDLFLEWTWERPLPVRKGRSASLSNRLYGGNRYVEDQLRGTWGFALPRQAELELVADLLVHDVRDEEAESEEDSTDVKGEASYRRPLGGDWVGRVHGEASSKTHSRETTYGFDLRSWSGEFVLERNRIDSSLAVTIDAEETRYPNDPGSSHLRHGQALSARRDLSGSLSLTYDYAHRTEDYPEDSVSLTSTSTGADSLVNEHGFELEWNAFGKGSFRLAWGEENTNYRRPDDVNFSNRLRSLEPGFTYAADMRWTFGIRYLMEKRVHRDAALDDGMVDTVIDETEQDHEKWCTRLETTYADARWSGSLSLAWGRIVYPRAEADATSLYADGKLFELFLSASRRLRKDTSLNLSFARSWEGHPVAGVNDFASETLSIDMTRRF